MKRRRFWQHWPALLLGALVAAIFLAVLFAFEVKQTESALVMTFGKPKTEVVAGREQTKTYEPGLHWKWPYPIDRVWKHDNRLYCYELTKGQTEQIPTADHRQVIVTTFVLWKVGEPERYLKSLSTTERAEEKLDDIVRNSRAVVLARHALSELINTDKDRVKIPEIEAEIRDDLREVALEKYGIDVQYVGFKHIGFPQDVTVSVFKRMRAERKRRSDKSRWEGKRDAQKIMAEADLEKSQLLAEAEAQAKRIRAGADRDAAECYAAFQKNPELAAYLLKLEALRKTLSKKTILVLDTNTPPYDLLRPGAVELKKKSSREGK